MCPKQGLVRTKSFTRKDDSYKFNRDLLDFNQDLLDSRIVGFFME
jgi:hypothetical protein